MGMERTSITGEPETAGRPGNSPAFLAPGFEHHIGHRFRCAAESREPTLGHDLANAGFSGLRPERESDLLRFRGRSAEHGGSRIVQTPDRIQVRFHIVMRERFHDHPRALRIERFIDMLRRAYRISHVVKAIEKRHQIVATAGIIRGRSDFELYAVGEARFRRPLARRFD